MTTEHDMTTAHADQQVGFTEDDAQYEADRVPTIDAKRAELCYALQELGKVCYDISYAHGFWEVLPRNKGEMIALMHSELSECLEAVRKPKNDEHCPGLSSEVVELADTIIRVLDYCHGHGLPIGRAVYEKSRYNEGRPHKHGKAF